MLEAEPCRLSNMNVIMAVMVIRQRSIRNTHCNFIVAVQEFLTRESHRVNMKPKTLEVVDLRLCRIGDDGSITCLQIVCSDVGNTV